MNEDFFGFGLTPACEYCKTFIDLSGEPNTYGFFEETSIDGVMREGYHHQECLEMYAGVNYGFFEGWKTKLEEAE